MAGEEIYPLIQMDGPSPNNPCWAMSCFVVGEIFRRVQQMSWGG
jgi:hypothetical protein